MILVRRLPTELACERPPTTAGPNAVGGTTPRSIKRRRENPGIRSTRRPSLGLAVEGLLYIQAVGRCRACIGGGQAKGRRPWAIWQ